MRTVEVLLSRPQADLIQATERYIDAEGAIRSGKSFAGAAWLANGVIEEPGIHCLACRWSESDLDAQLKPLWRETAARFGLTLQWHADEQYDEVVGYGSRVYLRGLKAGEQTSRYAKFRGLTLARILVDQAEEVPKDVFDELKGRLSQPGYRQQLVVMPNPPGADHWLAQEFRDDGPNAPDHKYIRFSIEDNRHILGDATTDAIIAAYPLGTAMRRRLIDGRRGLAAVGDPVYRGYFQRSLHVRDVSMDPQVPLLEGWDYGHGHPAVVWEQRLPWGELRVLGGVMGHNMFLPDFAKVALQYRAAWFPNPLEVQSTGDPAGEAQSNQGVPQRAVDVLAEMGVTCRSVPGANHPERRNYAIQQTADYMRRRTMQGEAFSISPRFVFLTAQGARPMSVLVDGFEAGYVWDERSLAATASPNTRRPKKDGFYDHTQNCHEYIELCFGVTQPSKQTVRVDDRKALKRLQVDDHPIDRARRRVHVGRGGY